MTEQEKMLRGMLYDPSDKTLAELRLKAHRLWQEYNLLFHPFYLQNQTKSNTFAKSFNFYTIPN